MFHNYGCGRKHTSDRDPPTARNARRLAKKKMKWKPVYDWEGNIICERITIDENPNFSYEQMEKALEYF